MKTGYERDIEDLVALGLNEARLRKHSVEEISLACCATYESDKDKEMVEQMGDEGAAAMYAESALGW